MDFEFFEPGSVTPDAQQSTIQFWTDHQVLDLETATKRSSDLISFCIVDDKIEAVATGHVGIAYQLGQPVFHYRSYVTESHRNKGVATQLLLANYDRLEHFFTKQENPSAIGILCEFDHSLARHFSQQLRWPKTQFSFIGRTQSGNHLRIRYFETVKLKTRERT